MDYNDEEWRAFLDEMRGAPQDNVPLDAFSCDFRNMSREYDQWLGFNQQSNDHPEFPNSKLGSYYTLSPPAWMTTFNREVEATEAAPQLNSVNGNHHEERAESDLKSLVKGLEDQ